MQKQIFEQARLLLENADVKIKFEELLTSPSFKQAYKQYFPKTYARYGAVSNIPRIVTEINKKAKLNKPLTSYINKRIDKKESNGNLGVNVFTISDNDINAFTISGFHLGIDPKTITLHQALFGSSAAKQYGIDGSTSKNGKIVLNASKRVSPLIFMTSGFAKSTKFNDAERTAVIMHEIGHWSASALSSQSIQPYIRLLKPLLRVGFAGSLLTRVFTTSHSVYMTALMATVIMLIIFAFIFFWNGSLSRSAEFAADSFSKSTGYGPPLISFLTKVGGNSIAPTSKEMLADMSSMDDKLSAITDFLSIEQHPSNYRRTKALLDSTMIGEGLDMLSVEKMLIPMASKIDSALSTGPIQPLLWAYSSK